MSWSALMKICHKPPVNYKNQLETFPQKEERFLLQGCKRWDPSAVIFDTEMKFIYLYVSSL